MPKPKYRKILRRAQMRERCGDPSDATVWRWEKRGTFPQRIQLSENSVGWFEDEIDAWVAERARGASANRRTHSALQVRAANFQRRKAAASDPDARPAIVASAKGDAQ